MINEVVEINNMVDRVFLELWKRKTRGSELEEEYFKDFPIRKFNIIRMGELFTAKDSLSERSLQRILAILTDLKLLFYFLGNINDYFYVGMAKIVIESNYHEVGLNTLSLLQGNHYKVFLLSVIYEKVLDLLELINFNTLTDPKRDKWGKKYNKLSKIEGFSIISHSEHQKMIDFRDNIRRGEIHGFSSVFRQLKRDEWDHFQDEARMLQNILLKIADKFGSLG